MNDLVSIIMPSYNTGKYISESIKSVINQTYTNWELIIVDDCSTDDTLGIINRFDDCRIKCFKKDNNSGAAISRNFALAKAKGKWVAFLDSDDIWYPEKLEKQIKFMEDNNYHFTYTNYEEIDESGAPIGKIVTGPKIVSKIRMNNYCWPGCLTVIYDQTFVGLVQIENIAKNNDYAMWLKIVKSTKCYLLDETLAKYRRGRQNSISTTNYINLMKWHYKLFREVERQSIVISFLNMLRNMFFGVIKKVCYVKKTI